MNKEILTRIAKQAKLIGQMVANYPDPDNPKVTFPPSPYYRFLKLLAEKINARLSVELGVCGGGGSLHLAMGSVQAVGVDVTYAEYLDNVEWLALHYPNLQLYEDDSIRMAPVIYNRHGSIDILFIDTTHTYEQTMSEYFAYKGFLSDNHYVILDDLFRPGMDLAWEEMPQPKVRFDFLHPSQSPTDGGFGVVWK
jgi:predicted O-methyltransferase YrrM